MSKPESILQLYARSPAPCRDYFGLTVNVDNVILNVWNISHGPHIYPKRSKLSLNEFCDDKSIQNEVQRLFGGHVLNYVLRLAKGDLNLQYFSSRVFLYILRHLASNDILNLSQTSKIFFELCNTNKAWEILFRKRTKTKPSIADKIRSESLTWKEILKSKIIRSVIQPKTPSESNNKSIYTNKSCSKASLTSSKDSQNSSMNSRIDLTKTIGSKSPLHLTTQKLQKASASTQNLISNCQQNLKEVVKMQGKTRHQKVEAKPNKILNEFGTIDYHMSSPVVNLEDYEKKLKRLKKMGVLPENPKHLQKTTVSTKNDTGKTQVQRKTMNHPPAPPNSQTTNTKKLESNTYIDLITSFRNSNKELDNKKFNARSAVNMQPASMVKSNPISVKKTYQTSEAKDYLMHMEGAKMDGISLERLKVLKNIEDKIKTERDPAFGQLTAKSLGKIMNAKNGAKKVATKAVGLSKA